MKEERHRFSTHCCFHRCNKQPVASISQDQYCPCLYWVQGVEGEKMYQELKATNSSQKATGPYATDGINDTMYRMLWQLSKN